MKNLYFLSYDSAFYWVRNCTLETALAESKQIKVAKITQTFNLGDRSILVFNRFGLSRFFRYAWRCALKLKIPYIVDIDDLFWELPEFSKDPARDPANVKLVEELIAGANALITTNKKLQLKLALRYNKRVYIIPNARPNWIAPSGGVLIANTDAFKMNKDDCQWFFNYLSDLCNAGVPLQFLGSPARFLEDLELDCYFQPARDYPGYLAFLNSGSFSSGIIPVGNSDYADCKSAIKVQEYLAANMQVYASNIAPYREFQAQYNTESLKLIDNTAQAWQQTVQEIIARITESARSALKTDSAGRRRQFNSWEETLSDLSLNTSFPNSNAYKIYRNFLRFYLNGITGLTKN